MDKILNCPVCCQKLRSPVTLICGHTFCFYCNHKALLQIPRCPLCRAYIQIKPESFKVNVIINQLIEKDDVDCVFKLSQPSIDQEQHFIIVQTKNTLYYYSFLKLQIQLYKESNLILNDYKECLNNAEIILSNTKQGISVLARVESIEINNNNVIMYALTQHQVKIIQQSIQIFFIESLDQFRNKDKKEILLPIGSGQFCQENSIISSQNLIELNEIKHQISQTIEKIFNQCHVIDAIEQEVYQKLQQSGLFEYLSESDAGNLLKLSYCLPSLLQINENVKLNIIQQPIVKRLKLAQQQLNKLSFNQHSGMIFEIPNDHPTSPFIQLGIVIIFIILYFIFIN